MLSQTIRRQFLKYFKDKGHTVVPSSPVVPHDDPTLLFINAGMNQFKDVFLGKSTRDYKRAASSQKCIRVGGKHNDLDNVGHTSRHLTFFEMLGNFSFGDYFKEQAIAFAWEVTTSVFGFNPEHIWITVFEKDDEAFELWKKWVPQKRIVRMGEKDNFWAMGDTGPCGPCSELLYDRGDKYGKASSPKEDLSGERFLEFWNVVFMQFNRDATGHFHALSNKSIDTGSGLERVVALKMGVDNVFHTDVLRYLISAIETVSKKKYDVNDPYHPAFHVIADHLRSLAFAIADGAQPSNIERGYVLRKLLRRAVRYGKGIGLQQPFLTQVLPALIEVMGEDYPEIVTAQGRIAEILTLEEESFIRTLKRGGNILNTVIEKALKSPFKQISGEEAFKLKDTYGFPLEEILLIAKDYGLAVNIDAYQMLEEKAKEISRSQHTEQVQEAKESIYKSLVEKTGPNQFVGYTETLSECRVVALIKKGELCEAISEGDEAMVVLNQTPFYAEKGGQVGDVGVLTHGKTLFKVKDCQNPYPGVFTHIGVLEKGSLSIGEVVMAQIDEERRKLIANHHTATHLLHWALQQVLGPHIRQAGSLVEASRLRFDFNHHKPLSLEELRQIEDQINEKIRGNCSVMTYELSFEEAQKQPEIKQFFGEKYGSVVRVVDINFSKELCGGTHTHHSGTIGLFRITKESSIAAGVRRIEAVTGKAAEAFVREEEDLANQAAQLLKTSLAKLPEKTNQLLEENLQLKQQLRVLKQQSLKILAKELAQKVETINHLHCLIQKVNVDTEDLLVLGEELSSLVPSSVLLLGVQAEEHCQILIKVSSDLVKKGVLASTLIKEIAPIIGGGGGGKPEMAQAGGKKPQELLHAFETAKQFLKKL